MIASGVFDRFPNLQVVVGHMGEGLPFYYWRFGEDLARTTRNRLHKPVQQYFHDNLWVTTSAFFRDELLTLALSAMGEDRVMFWVDYPMASVKRHSKLTPWRHPMRSSGLCGVGPGGRVESRVNGADCVER